MRNKFKNSRVRTLRDVDYSDNFGKKFLDKDWFDAKWSDEHYFRRDWFNQKWMHRYKFDGK